MGSLDELYRERLETPSTWWWNGKNLLLATEPLVARWVVADDASGHALWIAARTTGPLLHIRACAIECFLKAIRVEQGAIKAKGSRYSGPLHDLLKIAKAAAVPTDTRVEEMLAELTTWYEMGRYPIGRTVASTFGLTSWNPGSEREGVFRAFVAQLMTHHDARLSRQDK